MPINYKTIPKDWKPANENIAIGTNGNDDLNKETDKKQKTKFKDLSESDKFLYYLAEKTEGYVGADIEAVCREAAILALRKDIKAKEVTLQHFEDSLKKVPPSTTKEVEKAYEDLKDHFSSARAKQMKEEKPAYMG